MYYADIKNVDVANGPGIRVSLFVSGCTHHCKDCFNPESWDFNYGKPFDEEAAGKMMALLEPAMCAACPCWAASLCPGEPGGCPGLCPSGAGEVPPEGHLVLDRVPL